MIKILMETAALEQKGGRIHGSLGYNPFVLLGPAIFILLYRIYEIIDCV